MCLILRHCFQELALIQVHNKILWEALLRIFSYLEIHTVCANRDIIKSARTSFKFSLVLPYSKGHTISTISLCCQVCTVTIFFIHNMTPFNL